MDTSVLTRREASARLAAAEAEIRAFGVTRLALFGSVMRDTARPDSDVDLLVEFAPGAKTYAHFSALADLLEARLGHRVELVAPKPSRRSWGRAFWLRRRMSFEPRDYLRHILLEIDYLIGQSAGLTSEAFLADETSRRAFVRSIEVIGEAAKKVPDSFRAQHPDIEWGAMAGMRDRLINDYFGVDYELVWDVVAKRIPELRGRIAAILEA